MYGGEGMIFTQGAPTNGKKDILTILKKNGAPVMYVLFWIDFALRFGVTVPWSLFLPILSLH